MRQAQHSSTNHACKAASSETRAISKTRQLGSISETSSNVGINYMCWGIWVISESQVGVPHESKIMCHSVTAATRPLQTQGLGRRGWEPIK